MVDTTSPSAEDSLYLKDGTLLWNELNKVSEKSAFGNMGNTIGRMFYGINHRSQPGFVPINKDYHGLTFFTRPELNFSTVNLQTERKMTRLLSGSQYSLETFIRCQLDNRVMNSNNEMKSPLVDNNQAFIPLLTNTLLSISGWPDDINATFSSDSGLYGEVYGFIDGPAENYGTYDVTANFRNIIGDPITKLFYYWSRYAKLVHEGIYLVPYPENLMEMRVDYNTRVYRLVLDDSKTYVTEIAACGAAFPLSSPTGAKFNYESDKPINQSNDQISIPLRCFGFVVYDDILIKEFNDTVAMFNSGMTVTNLNSGYYIKVPQVALSLFNNYGYPRIDPVTRELQFFVSRTVFEHFLPGVLNSDDTTSSDTASKILDAIGVPEL